MKRFVLLTLCLVLIFTASVNLFAEEKLKVGVAYLWTIRDMGWTTAHYKGIQYMRAVVGSEIEIIEKEKVMTATDAEAVMRDFIAQGCKLIFGTTYSHMDAMEILSAEFPDVIFEHCSGYKKNDTNFGNYFMRMYQGEYLAGYMAGLMGFKNIGTVATNPIPEPVRGINAFTIGLLKGLNEAEMKHNAEKVNTPIWLNAWRDETNETLYAEMLSVKGHDLIRQMADTPDSSRAACAKGVPAIGYGEDVSQYGVKCALLSSIWNWGPYYVDSVQRVLDGTWEPGDPWWGFDKGGMKISNFHDSVPMDVRNKVLAEKAKLDVGEDDIFIGPIYDNTGELRVPEGGKLTDMDLLTMNWLVQGVVGKLPK